MSDYLEIHPKNPDGRSIRKIAESLRNGGVVVYPTDSTYAVGCHLGDKSAWSAFAGFAVYQISITLR